MRAEAVSLTSAPRCTSRRRRRTCKAARNIQNGTKEMRCRVDLDEMREAETSSLWCRRLLAVTGRVEEAVCGSAEPKEDGMQG